MIINILQMGKSKRSPTVNKTTLYLNLSLNRLATNTVVSRNLSTQFTTHVSVFPSNLLPGLSTHFSQHMSVNSWICCWNLYFWSSAISSACSFWSSCKLPDAPPYDILNEDQPKFRARKFTFARAIKMADCVNALDLGTNQLKSVGFQGFSDHLYSWTHG